MSRILIVEDEPVIRGALRQLLERNQYHVEDAGSVGEATDRFDLGVFDLILCDLRLPGEPGTEIIRSAGDVPVLIMTSHASVRSAVDAMKLGAENYIAKPFDHDELLVLIRRILKQSQMSRQREVLKQQVEENYPVSGMVGSCPAMREIFTRINKVAPTPTTVLILGESGTGKELVARAVHERSDRADAPIVAVNCAAIPADHIESELFGHEKGAFSGAVEARRGMVETAEGGSLFLDEISELSQEAQARLLRVLQNGEIRRIGSNQARHANVRLITATNQDLAKKVQTGEFRSDLYFRLRVMEIHLPPLRERGGDITELTHYLAGKICRRLNRPAMDVPPETLSAILKHHWPGNVRELENALERAAILAEGDILTPNLLALENARPADECPPPEEEPDPEANKNQSLTEYFKHFVLTHQNQLTETELAKRLGISRKALWERRNRLDLPRPKKS